MVDGSSALTFAAASAGLGISDFAGTAVDGGACGAATAAAAADVGGVNAGAGASTDFFCSSVGRNGSGTRGRFGVTPFELRGRISGVIITTSSVRSFCAASLRNSNPRIGMSPMPGTFCIVLLTWLLISPAMANV